MKELRGEAVAAQLEQVTAAAVASIRAQAARLYQDLVATGHGSATRPPGAR